jgi:hypothetical protein
VYLTRVGAVGCLASNGCGVCSSKTVMKRSSNVKQHQGKQLHWALESSKEEERVAMGLDVPTQGGAAA